MENKTYKNYSKFNNYEIPNNILKQNILDIKNQINAKLFSLTNDNKNEMFINERFDGINKGKDKSSKISYSMRGRPIPSLLKSVINNSQNLNNEQPNSEKNNSNKMVKSFNFIKIVKKHRPSSSYVSNNNLSMNDKNNKNELFKIHSKLNENKNNDINNSKNRPISSKFKKKNLNIFKKSIEKNNKNGNEKETDSYMFKMKRNNSSIYTIKLNNKSEPVKFENLRYNSNDGTKPDNRKQNITSSYKKVNIINNNYISRTNKQNISQNNTIKFYSMDNNNKSNINKIKNFVKKSKNLSDILDNKNESDLIHYKYIFYSSKNNINKNIDKIKKYNNLIRLRNEQKNKNKEKRYSFYKYKEYMNKIEKEDFEMFLKQQAKKNLFNIQEIFGEITSRNKSKKNTLLYNVKKRT